ncbi:MAG: FMN-binding protein [Longimicrobiales bacterium]|nr:FMN-binding protein [Longimicrobiales bacterium]
MSTRLPTVEGSPEGPENDGPSTFEAPARTASPRLVATLALAGALAGLVLVAVHQWTQPRILEHQARVLQEAVTEVLGGPESTHTYFRVEGAWTARPPADADTASADRVYIGFDATGAPIGVALAAGEPGFQDIIRIIFGYDPGAGVVLGMKVLESRETPGLGDKIEKDSTFVAEFRGVTTPLIGVKAGRARGDDAEVHLITGATISSRAIIDIINHRLEARGEEVRALWRSGIAPPPTVPADPGGER